MASTIVGNENGPYLIETGGRYAVDGGDAQEQAKIALCRCGQSENKPFCDGTHKHVGFEAPRVELTLDA